METKKDYTSIEPVTAQPEYCESQFGYEYQDGEYTLFRLRKPCGKQIETMSFKGTGVCGETHRKARERGKSREDKGFAIPLSLTD